MFTKLLLALGVIAIVIAAIRERRSPSAKQPLQSGRASEPSAARITAWTLIATIVAVTLGYSLLQRNNDDEVLTVRVVNGSSGQSTRYRVRRADLGDRRLRTIDGRTIVLAEVDRLEVHDSD